MVTAAKIKKIVQPLLDRHADLALVGRRLYVKPVHHFARAVFIDRTAYKDHSSPMLTAIHLFEARESFSISWSNRLIHKTDGRNWIATEPDFERLLIDAIEQQALPRLFAMNTLDDYLAYVSQHYIRHQLFDWPHCKVILDVAMGDLDSARAIFKTNIAKWSADRPDHDDDDRAMFRRLRELHARLADNDRPGMALLLHQWELYSVNRFKIEHLWEPTPFPLELQAAER
jgi:hypothetical protein